MVLGEEGFYERQHFGRVRERAEVVGAGHDVQLDAVFLGDLHLVVVEAALGLPDVPQGWSEDPLRSWPVVQRPLKVAVNAATSLRPSASETAAGSLKPKFAHDASNPSLVLICSASARVPLAVVVRSEAARTTREHGRHALGQRPRLTVRGRLAGHRLVTENSKRGDTGQHEADIARDIGPAQTAWNDT
jgi:hypothetical protein